MRSLLPTVVTAAFIALAYAAPVQTREIEVLQYGMICFFPVAVEQEDHSVPLTINTDIQTQHAIFSLPCTSCEAAQADLVCSPATYALPSLVILRTFCHSSIVLVLFLLLRFYPQVLTVAALDL